MKNINYLLLLLSLIFNFSFAQNQHVLETQKYTTSKASNKKLKDYFIAKNNKTEVVLLKFKKKPHSSYNKTTYHLSYYNSKKELITQKTFKLHSSEHMFVTNDSIFLLHALKKLTEPTSNNSFKNTKSIHYFISAADLKTLTFKEQNILNVNENNSTLNLGNFKFNYKIKSDTHENSSNYILHTDSNTYNPKRKNIQADCIINEGNDIEKKQKKYGTALNVALLNHQFKPTIKKTFFIENNIGELNFVKELVDPNTNAVYILASTFSKGALIKVKKKLNTTYHIFKVTSDKIEMKTLSNLNFSIATATISLYKDEIICAGAYSITNDSYLNGIFKLNFNKNDLTEFTNTTFNFTQKYIEDWKALHFTSTASSIKNSSNVSVPKIYHSQLSLDHFFINNDGNCYLSIVEYVVQKSSGGFGLPGMPLGGIILTVGITPSNIKNKSIILTKISKDNKLIWSRNLKYKYKKGDLVKTVHNGNYYILGDYIKKIYKKYNLNPVKTEGNNLFYLEVNHQGNVNSDIYQTSLKHKNVNILTSKKNADNISTDLFLEFNSKNVSQLNSLIFN